MAKLSQEAPTIGCEVKSTQSGAEAGQREVLHLLIELGGGTGGM